MTAEIREALGHVEGVSLESLPLADRREALVQWQRLISQLTARQLELVAACSDVAEADGHRDLTAWLTAHTGIDRSGARGSVELATSLQAHWSRVRAGLSAGALSLDQAQVIVAALDALPADLPAEIFVRAEEHLISLAEDFGPRELRNLGRAVLAAVAPKIADEHERKQLESEEARAFDTMRLTTRRLGTGATRITMNLPDGIADRLSTYLAAITNPRGSATDVGEAMPHSRRLAQAFCAQLERYDPKRLPLHGGDATTVMITMSLPQLRDQVGAVVGGEVLSGGGDLVGTETRLSAGEVRRLACTARLIPGGARRRL